jgi:hypothetical protein
LESNWASEIFDVIQVDVSHTDSAATITGFGANSSRSFFRLRQHKIQVVLNVSLGLRCRHERF